MVISIGKEEVNILTELTRDELKDFSFENETQVSINKESFQEILDKFKKK